MSNMVRNFVVAVGLLLGVFGGWRIARYFWVSRAPEFSVVGLRDGGQYAGTVPFSVQGTSAYKAREVSVWLDEKPVVEAAHIGLCQFNHPLKLDTKPVADGRHVVRVSVVDGSYHRNTATKQFAIDVDNSPLQASFDRPEPTYSVFQGKTAHVRVRVNRPLKSAVARAFSKEIYGVLEHEDSLTYEFFVPIDCEEPALEHQLTVVLEDNLGNRVQLVGKVRVVEFEFKKQVLYHIDAQAYEVQKRLGKEGFIEKLAQCAKASPRKKLWRGAFVVPLNMTKITCSFGSSRITQERGCYRHCALDLVGPLKATIWAPQDGVIVIKDRFEISGNAVVIDHGCGVLTILGHLDSFSDIKVGDTIKRGAPVGVMGRTGYATGDHLHWEMRVNDVRVDPMQWTQPNF